MLVAVVVVSFLFDCRASCVFRRRAVARIELRTLPRPTGCLARRKGYSASKTLCRDESPKVTSRSDAGLRCELSACCPTSGRITQARRRRKPSVDFTAMFVCQGCLADEALMLIGMSPLQNIIQEVKAEACRNRESHVVASCKPLKSVEALSPRGCTLGPGDSSMRIS